MCVVCHVENGTVSWYAHGDEEARIVLCVGLGALGHAVGSAVLSERAIRVVAEMVLPNVLDAAAACAEQACGAVVHMTALSCGAYSVGTGCVCNVALLGWKGVCDPCAFSWSRGERLFSVYSI
jgi:hypothetical protein